MDTHHHGESPESKGIPDVWATRILSPHGRGRIDGKRMELAAGANGGVQADVALGGDIRERSTAEVDPVAKQIAVDGSLAQRFARNSENFYLNWPGAVEEEVLALELEWTRGERAAIHGNEAVRPQPRPADAAAAAAIGSRMVLSPGGGAVIVDELIVDPQRRVAEFGPVAAVVSGVVRTFLAVRKEDLRLPSFIPERDLLPVETVATRDELQRGSAGAGVGLVPRRMPDAKAAMPHRSMAPGRGGVVFVADQNANCSAWFTGILLRYRSNRPC